MATFLAIALASLFDPLSVVGYLLAGLFIKRYPVAVAFALSWRILIHLLIMPRGSARFLIPALLGALVFVTVVYFVKKMIFAPEVKKINIDGENIEPSYLSEKVARKEVAREEVVLNASAAMLSAQIKLCGESGVAEFLDSKFARGYVFGFFDSSLQQNGVISKDDFVFLRRMQLAHRALFSNGLLHYLKIDADEFYKKSALLKVGEDACFFEGQKQGGSEYFDFYVDKRKKPLGLPGKFHQNN